MILNIALNYYTLRYLFHKNEKNLGNFLCNKDELTQELME
jgi:hypothetical protein